MAEHIEREAVLKIIGDNCPHDKGGYNTEEEMGAGAACYYIMKDVKNIPTADVVPRAEVEKIFDKYGNYDFPTEPKEDFNNTVVTGGYVIDWYKEAGLNAKRIMELEAEITKAKQEVAREIFEEIVKLLIFNTYEIACISNNSLIELRKKYIGE